jgi:UrcA family protein
MIISTLLAVSLAAAVPADAGRAPPVMRVPAAGLDLSTPRDSTIFAERVADQSRRFCATHLLAVTPDRADPRLCERGMGEAVVRALPEGHREAFMRSGGLLSLKRRQR